MVQQEKLKSSIIWLHGLGADGRDFEPIVPQLNLSKHLAIRFVFPDAPMRPVTINGGMVMRAWYDIKNLDSLQEEDETGIRASQALLNDLIEKELAQGISAERIILAGFSQGGAIALQTGLRYPKKLGGIIALSTYLPLPHTLEQEASEANHNIPIFMAHGTVDTLIPLAFAEQSKNYLLQNGYSVDWQTYPMMHSVCSEETTHISHWIQKIWT